MIRERRYVTLLLLALTMKFELVRTQNDTSVSVTESLSVTTSVMFEASSSSFNMLLPDTTSTSITSTQDNTVTSSQQLQTLSVTPTISSTSAISVETTSMVLVTSSPPEVVPSSRDITPSPTPTPSTVEETVATTTEPTTPPTSPPTNASPAPAFPMVAIIGIAAGGGALLIFIVIAILICCCCCCCSCSKSEDYVPDKPFMVVRTYDQNYAPDLDRSASLISNRSRGNSLRSSISSIASSIRSSIRRLSRRNRALGGGDGQIAMKVTPL